jgi:pimeloyl-ACP methyl ester carboxylesterase
MTDAVRTPDELLRGLPDFPFEPHYREVDGLRLAHLDEGDGAPVIFMHGEPTWSFLWRHVIPPVRDAGFRCLAPDLVGFGRSDKPMEIDWYSYDRHAASVASLLEDLDLRGATIVVHDWGGPIGLRLAVEHAERIERIVILDTGLFTGRQRMTDAWLAFRDFVARTEDLPGRDARARRVQERSGRRGDRRLRRAVPERGLEGRRARLPAADPAEPRRARGRGGAAGARGAARGPAPDAHTVGGLRPGAAARGGRELRRLDRPRRADRDRERLALPPGGPGTADRSHDRGVARRELRSREGGAWPAPAGAASFTISLRNRRRPY